MTEHIWTVDYQIFPDDLDPLGNPKGACFAYDGEGNEIDCAEIEARLDEYETLKRATEALSALCEEVHLAHCDSEDVDYNECDTAPCAWCEAYADILEGKDES